MKKIEGKGIKRKERIIGGRGENNDDEEEEEEMMDGCG